MTGLDERDHHILEIATVVTDRDLNLLDEGLAIVIHQSEEILSRMDNEVTQMHTRNGLVKDVRNSKISLDEATQQTMRYIRRHVPDTQKSPLCGNSVHSDKRFLRKWMPEVEAHLHYRIIDVSSVRLLAEHWLPSVERHRPRCSGSHRAMGDILQSIEELRFYRKHIFLMQPLVSPDSATGN